MILLTFCIILFTAYALLVLYYWYSWKHIPGSVLPAHIPATGLTVIIPARNEEENIAHLLTALADQTYPRAQTEVIVIDDHSTDNTAAVVKGFAGVRLISLKEDQLNSYKKKAIETGIANASGELIVCTDADCIPGPDWLLSMAGCYNERNSLFVAAPVVIDCNNSIVQIFQAMDFMVLQTITGAVVHNNKLSMCNGANIAYSKKAFNEVNGFNGIDTIASGDDMLLMYKIWKQNPGKVAYLKSKHAMVSTVPQKTWKEFFAQRIRWASKANKYEDKRFLPVLLLVYLFNLSFLGLFVAGFFDDTYWLWMAGFWLAKTLVELPLFISAADFFGKRWAIPWFIFFQPAHIFYTIISGLFGQFGTYKWKGREVK